MPKMEPPLAKLLPHIKAKARTLKKEHEKVFKICKTLKNKAVDELFNKTHHAVFEEINCLHCANCCKTTSPIFLQKDIERIAKFLRQTPSQFIQQYLQIDEDDDYVLQKSPCAFLQEGNLCSIYEVRPKACSEYPHTDRKNIMGLASLTLKNATICPAVFYILDNIKINFQNDGQRF